MNGGRHRPRPAVAAVLLAASMLPRGGGADGLSLESFDLPRPLPGGDLEVEVEPARLLLGDEVEAEVRASLPKGARGVRVRAARGVIDRVVLEDGRVRARYLAPDARLPGLDVVAVIAEVEDDVQLGFGVLQLYGQGQALIETRARAEAVIDIRGVRFGPVKADRRGHAMIHVVVPPGTEAGWDGEDNEVNLGIPAGCRLFAFAGKDEASVGGEAVPVFAVLLRPDGGIEEVEIEPRGSAGRGTLTEARRIGPGYYRWDWAVLEDDLPDDEVAPEQVIIELSWTDDVVSVEWVEMKLVFPAAEQPAAEQQEEPLPEVPGERKAPPLLLAPKLGYVTNMGAIHGLGAGLELGARLPLLDGALLLVAEPGVAWSGTDGTPPAGEDERASLRASTLVVPLTLGLSWHTAMTRGSYLSLSATGGVALLSNRITGKGSGGVEVASSERGPAPAAGGALGAGFRLGPGALLLEVGYLWIGGGLESLRGNPSMLQVRLGYVFGLGR